MFRSKADDLDTKDAENAIAKMGADLARLRAKRGERLEDIAEYLGIKSTYLYGIELGDLSIISSKRNVRSFIFSYANYLGLDGDAITSKLAPIIDGLEGAKAPSSFWGLKGVDRSSAIILGTSVFLGVIAGWWYLGDTAKLDLIASPVTASAIDNAGDNAGEAGGDDEIVAETGDDSDAETLASEAEVALANLEKQAEELAAAELAINDTSNQVAALSDDQIPEISPKKDEIPANVLATLVAKRGGAEIFETQNTDARVIVRALSASWVQVSSADRAYVWTRTMQPREMLLVPNRDDLELWAGDASGVEILLDGAVLPGLGPAGTVVRGVSLAPKSLQAFSTAADLEGSTKPTF